MSLFEMIPDRPLIMPAGSHAARTDADKKFGLRERKCAYCQQIYYRRSGEREYTRRRGDKKLVFCTWSHACRWEEENPKVKKARPAKPKKKATQERVDYLMRRLTGLRVQLDSEEGRAMSTEDRNRLRSRMRWHAHEIRKLMEELGNEAERDS